MRLKEFPECKYLKELNYKQYLYFLFWQLIIYLNCIKLCMLNLIKGTNRIESYKYLDGSYKIEFISGNIYILSFILKYVPKCSNYRFYSEQQLSRIFSNKILAMKRPISNAYFTFKNLFWNVGSHYYDYIRFYFLSITMLYHLFYEIFYVGPLILCCTRWQKLDIVLAFATLKGTNRNFDHSLITIIIIKPYFYMNKS